MIVTMRMIRSTPRLVRTLSSEAPKFDKEMVEMYSHIAPQHMHKNGPWKAILEKVNTLNLSAGSQLIDIATGPGEPATLIAKELPHLHVIATDVSEDMIEKASNHAKDLKNMTAVVMDAQDMSDFETSSIDCITCCYGFMFPEDKEKAVSEAYRVLKPGGTLISTHWQDLDMLKITKEVMTAVLGHTPDPPALNPMSLAEPDLFESMLRDQGFSNVKSVESCYPFDFSDNKDFQFKLSTFLVKEEIEELNAFDVAREAFNKNIHKFGKEDSQGSLIIENNIFSLVTAEKK